MAHIAVIMTGLTGNLNSSLELCNRLKKEGHTITYLAIRDIKEKILPYNIKYIQLPEITYSISSKELGFSNKSFFKKKIFHLKNREDIYKKSIQFLSLNEYEKILKSLNPDKVIIDQEIHDLIFISYKLGIPITLVSSWFNHIKDSELKLPPIRTSIVPNNGFKGSCLNILINWLFIKLKVYARIVVNKLYFNDYRRATLKRYAKSNGFPIKKLVATNLPNLFSYTSFPLLSFTMKEMDFQHKPPRNFVYVGAMVSENRIIKTDKEPILEKIIKIKSNENKKIIYCAASSLLDIEKKFIDALIKIVENKKKWILVISLGGKLPQGSFKSKSENIFILSWVPTMKILNYADCCINHGGINTINECIHFKVPMLVYSGKKFDQNGCAARIKYHKLGLIGDKDNFDAQSLKNNLHELLNSKAFSDSAKKFNELYLKYRDIKLTPLLN